MDIGWCMQIIFEVPSMWLIDFACFIGLFLLSFFNIMSVSVSESDHSWERKRKNNLQFLKKHIVLVA